MIFSTLLFLFIETPIIFFNNEILATGFFAKLFSVDDTTSWQYFGSMTFWQHFSVNELFVTYFGQLPFRNINGSMTLNDIFCSLIAIKQRPSRAFW